MGAPIQISCLSKVCAFTEKQHFLVCREGILRTLTNACEEFRRKQVSTSLVINLGNGQDVGLLELRLHRLAFEADLSIFTVPFAEHGT